MNPDRALRKLKENQKRKWVYNSVSLISGCRSPFAARKLKTCTKEESPRNSFTHVWMHGVLCQSRTA